MGKLKQTLGSQLLVYMMYALHKTENVIKLLPDLVPKGMKLVVQ